MNCPRLSHGDLAVTGNTIATAGILIALAIQLGCAAVSTRSVPPCAGADSAGCLSENFDEMLMHHEDTFWAILERASDLRLLCSTSDEPTRFLQLVVPGGGAAHFAEYFHKAVERMLTSQPECFLKRVAASPKPVQREVFYALATPWTMERTQLEATIDALADPLRQFARTSLAEAPAELLKLCLDRGGRYDQCQMK